MGQQHVWSWDSHRQSRAAEPHGVGRGVCASIIRRAKAHRSARQAIARLRPPGPRGAAALTRLVGLRYDPCSNPQAWRCAALLAALRMPPPPHPPRRWLAFSRATKNELKCLAGPGLITPPAPPTASKVGKHQRGSGAGRDPSRRCPWPRHAWSGCVAGIGPSTAAASSAPPTTCRYSILDGNVQRSGADTEPPAPQPPSGSWPAGSWTTSV